FFQAEDGIRDFHVTGVQTCALPILSTVWISGLVLADDGVDEVWLNGRRIDVKAWKDWGYGVAYTNFHPIEIRSGFLPGVNHLSRSEERRVGKEWRSRWCP